MRLSVKQRLLRKTGIVCASAMATAGFLTPVAASATSLPGYSPDVQDAAIAAVQQSDRVDASTAAQILRTQDQGAKTLANVTSQLGDRAAGGYLDAAGKPVVNALDEGAAQTARANGAQARIVKHSPAALDEARRALEAVPAVAHTSIGSDEAANQLVVTVADAARGADRLLAVAAQFGDRVRVEHVAGTMEKAVYNGQAITGSGIRCSAGFNTNRGGVNYLVDAGHCTRATSTWNVGTTVSSSFPGNDYGLIRYAAGQSAPGAVWLWSGSSTQRITSAANATVGQRICKSGSTTYLTCGNVQRTNVTVNYQEGAVHQLVQTSARVGPGDSGGCLFAGSTGLGITSGMGGGSSFFQPVVEALNAYGVTLN